MPMPSVPFEAEKISYRWVVLAGVWLLYFSFGMIVAAMAPLVRPIAVALDLDNGDMGFVLGAWPLVYVAAAIPCGVLLDRFGPRRALLIGVTVIAASGAVRIRRREFRGRGHKQLSLLQARAARRR